MLSVPKMRMSSTNNKCVRKRYTQIFHPENFTSTVVFFISRLRPSITRRNNIGNKGQPCRMPLPALNEQEGLPFMRIEKFAEDTQAKIQFVT
jgi:hypothetical protein